MSWVGGQVQRKAQTTGSQSKMYPEPVKFEICKLSTSSQECLRESSKSQFIFEWDIRELDSGRD